MVSTVSPKAKLTPRNPMPSVGKPAASTALPQPANVSQKVPKNSAPRRRGIYMIPSPCFLPVWMIEEVALLTIMFVSEGITKRVRLHRYECHVKEAAMTEFDAVDGSSEFVGP